jgi:hypothetical protein
MSLENVDSNVSPLIKFVKEHKSLLNEYTPKNVTEDDRQRLQVFLTIFRRNLAILKIYKNELQLNKGNYIGFVGRHTTKYNMVNKKISEGIENYENFIELITKMNESEVGPHSKFGTGGRRKNKSKKNQRGKSKKSQRGKSKKNQRR